jgi:hypothetical protein
MSKSIQRKGFDIEISLLSSDECLIGLSAARGFDEWGIEFRQFSIGFFLFTVSLIFKTDV